MVWWSSVMVIPHQSWQLFIYIINYPTSQHSRCSHTTIWYNHISTHGRHIHTTCKQYTIILRLKFQSVTKFDTYWVFVNNIIINKYNFQIKHLGPISQYPMKSLIKLTFLDNLYRVLQIMFIYLLDIRLLRVTAY